MSNHETGFAYRGNSFKDAKERQKRGEENKVTTFQMQQWSNGSDPNHELYKSLRTPEQGDFLYGIHICKEECERTDNKLVGGGSLTFHKEGLNGEAAYFARRVGGKASDVCRNICDAKLDFLDDNKSEEKERAPSNPSLKNIIRLEFNQNDEPLINDLFVKVNRWPQRIADNKKSEIIDYLGDRLGTRINNLIRVKKDYQDFNDAEPNITFIDRALGNIQLWMKCFNKQSIRIFRCGRGEITSRRGGKYIGNFEEWIGEQNLRERNFKYDKNDLLLLWIPDKDNNCTNDFDWRERCEDDVVTIIDDLEQHPITKDSFKTFKNDKYKGFFILIGDRKNGIGDQMPILKNGHNVNNLLQELFQARRSNASRRIPYWSFDLKAQNMNVSWLEGNNVHYANDDGMAHSLKTINGEISLLITLDEIEEDERKQRTSIQIRLKERNNGTNRVIKGVAGIIGRKNASISLRIKNKGDYTLILKSSNEQFRKLYISVEADSNHSNEIYCKNVGWKKWSETIWKNRFIAEPDSQKKLLEKIFQEDYPNLSDYIDLNDNEWKKKENRDGLMMEINRAVFQMIKDNTGKKYVDSGSWTKMTRRIYSHLEWLYWPNLEEDKRLEVPKIGILQKRAGDPVNPVAVVNNKSHLYADLNCSYDDVKWAWQEYYIDNNASFLMEELTHGRGVIYATKTFKHLVENNPSQELKIYIDYKTGFRYYEFLSLWKDGKKHYDYLESLRPYGFIYFKARDFLRSFWNEIECFAKTIDDSTHKDDWETRRFSFNKSERRTERLDLRTLSEQLTENLQTAKGRIRGDWTKQFSEAMGVDVDWEDYDWLVERLEHLEEYNYEWTGKKYYQNGGRRQLFLELEYFNSNENLGDERIPVNLYLGCLYNLDLEDFSGKNHEKRVLIASSDGWNEISNNQSWVDKKNRVSKPGEFIENRIKNLWWMGPMMNDENEEDLRKRLHFSWTINSFSDTRYVEREVFRAFRSIYESENNIITDPKKTGGKEIPGFLYDVKEEPWNIKYEGWLWDVRIDGLSRCFPNKYNIDQIESIKLNYQKDILKRLWWNVDES